jgi:hypothetical protein
MTCAQPAALDQACHPDDATSCQQELYCACPEPCAVDGTVAQPGHQCRPSRDDGAACESPRQCRSGTCEGVCQPSLCQSR